MAHHHADDPREERRDDDRFGRGASEVSGDRVEGLVEGQGFPTRGESRSRKSRDPRTRGEPTGEPT